MRWLINFWLEEKGQDLIEYSLLITFIAIACLALIGAGQPSVRAIWTTGDNSLKTAKDGLPGG